MKFGKKIFWQNFDGRFTIDEVGGGDAGGDVGGGGSGPDSSGSNGNIETASGGDAGLQSDSGSNSGGQTTSAVLDGAPGERGTQEYQDWFSNLSYEERIKVESELANGYEFKPKKEHQDQSVKPNEGENQNAASSDDPGEWTPEEFAKLDPASQSRIQQMQGIISQFAPYLDGSLDKGLEIVQNDPIIKARLQEIQENGENSIPAQITKQFDVLNYLNEEDKKVFGLLDDKGKSSFLQAISRAYEDGAKTGIISEQYNTKEALLKEQRLNSYTQQLNKIITGTPSLKVPVDAKGEPVPFKDPSHPLNPYLKWASQNLSDAQLDKIGHKAGYAAYLAATGQQDQAMENVAKHVRTNFLKNLDNLDKTIATTAGRSTQSPQGQGTKMYNGIDLNKYKTDIAYRQQVFLGADQKTRTNLERFIYSNEVPTN